MFFILNTYTEEFIYYKHNKIFSKRQTENTKIKNKNKWTYFAKNKRMFTSKMRTDSVKLI